jgi:hypothetical protein
VRVSLLLLTLWLWLWNGSLLTSYMLYGQWVL